MGVGRQGILLILILFRQDEPFRVGRGGGEKDPLPKTCLENPTMMKLGTYLT